MKLDVDDRFENVVIYLAVLPQVRFVDRRWPKVHSSFYKARWNRLETQPLT